MARNIGASVNDRLRRIAKETGGDMVTIQTRYALERLLWRMTQTTWGESMALKGALIFVAHTGDTHRPTADIDIDHTDENGTADMVCQMVRDAAAVEVDDGVEFVVSSIEVRKDRDWSAVRGAKVALYARIDTSQVRIPIDAGFGNVIVPDAQMREYPSLLADMPRPMVRIYPFESMIAEKVHAMARHGAETTRLRDYYDLWSLSECREFDGEVLAEAIRRTFEQWKHILPKTFDALSDDFVKTSSRQWNAYRGAKGLKFKAPELREVVDRINIFLLPAVEAAKGHPVPGVWSPETGWKKELSLSPSLVAVLP